MPQSWQEHWGADIAGDPVAALRRDGCVQLLGNLTLVTGKLNPAMSNRPWAVQEAVARGLGGEGKHGYLLRHSQLNLNAEIVAEHQDVWTEGDIRARTDSLIGRVVSIWPRPETGVQQAGPVTLTTRAGRAAEWSGRGSCRRVWAARRMASVAALGTAYDTGTRMRTRSSHTMPWFRTLRASRGRYELPAQGPQSEYLHPTRLRHARRGRTDRGVVGQGRRSPPRTAVVTGSSTAPCTPSSCRA